MCGEKDEVPGAKTQRFRIPCRQACPDASCPSCLGGPSGAFCLSLEPSQSYSRASRKDRRHWSGEIRFPKQEQKSVPRTFSSRRLSLSTAALTSC